MTTRKSNDFNDVKAVEVEITTSEPGAMQHLNNRFASSEYDDPDARKPRLQPLRGEDPKQFGFFISHSALAECSWLSLEMKDMIKYTFQSGEEEDGLLIKKPRMLVHQTSPLFAYDRAASQAAKRIVAEVFDSVIHADRDKYGVGCVYEVILLDRDNKPLHEIPLQMMVKGATSASFSTQWQNFLTEVTALHAKAFNIPIRGKNAMFNSLCVFCPSLDRIVVGQKVKSPALYITGHEIPTVDNWTDYFIGCSPDEVINYFTQQFNYRNRLLPSSIAIATLEP